VEKKKQCKMEGGVGRGVEGGLEDSSAHEAKSILRGEDLRGKWGQG